MEFNFNGENMIDKKLSEIIIKYNIDKYYPMYKKMLSAIVVIREVIDGWKSKKILCLCTSELSKTHFEKIVASEYRELSLDIDYIIVEKADCYINNQIEQYISNSDLEKYDEIWNINNAGSFFIDETIISLGFKINDLYDCFELKGIVFEAEWYDLFQHNTGFFTSQNIEKAKDWKNYAIAEMLQLKEKSESCVKKPLKLLYLKKMLFVSLYIKDFIEANRIIQLLNNLGEDYSKLEDALGDLIDNIKTKLKSRNKKDLIVYWIDKTPYSDFPKLNKLYHKCTENANIFTNFYTMNPYTYPSFAQIFTEKKPIDEDGCFSGVEDYEQGNLIRMLTEKGYNIKIVGGVLEKKVATIHKSTLFHDEFSPASEILWDCVRNILDSSNTIFVLGHMVIEGHEPNMSVRVKNITDNRTRYDDCLKYIDDQIEFYDGLLSESCIKIYMSDHGKSDFKTRFHTIMAVERNGMLRGTNEKLLCLLDTRQIIGLAIDGKDFSSIKERQYVEVQDYNHMNGFDIGVTIKKRGRIDNLIRGYRGVITKKYTYIKFSSGNEWLYQNVGRRVFPLEPIWIQRETDLAGCDNQTELERFRNIVTVENAYKKIEKYEKYNKYVWKIYENAYEKNRKKVELIDLLFDEIDSNSVALRTGGYHSLCLYSLLSASNREKIKYIIDSNEDCLCKQLGIRIVSSLQSDIDTVVLSSKDLLEELLKESQLNSDYRNVTVINPYDWLAQKGIICRLNCFDFEPDYEDYEVGYPFGEVGL